jgi:hypothetical protein
MEFQVRVSFKHDTSYSKPTLNATIFKGVIFWLDRCGAFLEFAQLKVPLSQKVFFLRHKYPKMSAKSQSWVTSLALGGEYSGSWFGTNFLGFEIFFEIKPPLASWCKFKMSPGCGNYFRKYGMPLNSQDVLKL